MKQCRGILLLLAALITYSHAGLAAEHAFVQGVLLNATVDEQVKKGSTLARAIYVLQVGDIAYTVRGERVKTGTKDYTKGMIIGDPVQASVEGEHVFLRTPKGKEIKTDVLKRARAQRP